MTLPEYAAVSFSAPPRPERPPELEPCTEEELVPTRGLDPADPVVPDTAAVVDPAFPPPPKVPPEDGLSVEGADAPLLDAVLAALLEGVTLEVEPCAWEGVEASASALSFLFRASAAAASPSDCAEDDEDARTLKTSPRARAEDVRMEGPPV